MLAPASSMESLGWYVTCCHWESSGWRVDWSEMEVATGLLVWRACASGNEKNCVDDHLTGVDLLALLTLPYLSSFAIAYRPVAVLFTMCDVRSEARRVRDPSQDARHKEEDTAPKRSAATTIPTRNVIGRRRSPRNNTREDSESTALPVAAPQQHHAHPHPSILLCPP